MPLRLRSLRAPISERTGSHVACAAHGRRMGHPQYEKGAVLRGTTATSDSIRVTPRGARRRARRHRIVVTGQTFRG